MRLKLIIELDPYVPQAQIKPALTSVQANGKFSDAEMAQINNHNALSVFPRVAAKLGFSIA